MNVLYPDSFTSLSVVNQLLLQYYLQKKEYAKIARVIFEGQYALISTDNFSDGDAHGAVIDYLRQDLVSSYRAKLSGKRKSGFFARYDVLSYQQVESAIPSLTGHLLNAFLVGVSIIANCNSDKQDAFDDAYVAPMAMADDCPFLGVTLCPKIE